MPAVALGRPVVSAAARYVFRPVERAVADRVAHVGWVEVFYERDHDVWVAYCGWCQTISADHASGTDALLGLFCALGPDGTAPDVALWPWIGGSL